MMYLKEYSHFNSFFSLDSISGEAHAVAKIEGKHSGFLSILEGNTVAAIYRTGGILTLQIGKEKWNYTPALSTSHQHMDGGKTLFTIFDKGEKIYSLEYTSWWVRLETHLPPALGELANDDEDDFLGYVHSALLDESKGVKRGLAWQDTV
jgi:hypothetical protein